MNLTDRIQELRARKVRCERAIALLEDLQNSSRSKRRGRKYMATDERRRVSVRMKNYWDGRRRELASPGSDSRPPEEGSASGGNWSLAHAQAGL